MKWGRYDQAVTANDTTTTETTIGAPIGTYALVNGGTATHGANANFGNTSPGSRANVDVAMFNNATPGAFVTGKAVGVFGVSATEMANNTINHSKDQPQHAGWNIRHAGTGPVINVAITAAGSGFANGESINISNGTTNATITVTTNATGNATSLTVVHPGAGFTNTAIGVITFNREQHVANVIVAGTATGYNNTDVLAISNGTINGTATFVTNATGGFTTANVTITNPGLFVNNAANNTVVVTAKAANGAASLGSGATFTANLATSTGGTVTFTLGGRSGRVWYETIVAMGSLGVNTSTSTGVTGNSSVVTDATTDNTYFPGV